MAILPSGYTQLEYIESTGTQYIDTRVIAKSTLKIQIQFNISEQVGYSIVGYYNNANDSFRFFNANSQCYLDFGNAINNRIFGSNIIPGDFYNIEFSNFYVKNIDTNIIIISGNEVGYFIKSTPIYLCGNSNYAKGKFYSLKIYDNNTIIRDYIPSKNINGDNGLYDLINKNFYKSNGDNFIAGPEIINNLNTYLKLNNSWIESKEIYGKINNVWQPVTGIYTKTNNTW